MTTKQLTIIETLEQEVTAIATQQVSISSTSEMTSASERRAWLKDKIKFLKDHKEVLYRPYKDKIDQINEVYKPIEKMLTDSEKAYSAEMSRYQTALIASAKIESDKIAARVKEGSGNLSAHTAMERMNAIEKPSVLAETNFINRPKLSIVDITLIPHSYFILDEKALKADLDKGIVVPGATLVDSFEPRSK